MAIVQISKIQQRAGNLVDLPQLDNAEFGWATDDKRLFIGRTGNTVQNENIEVLTSYSTISFSQVDGSDGGNLNINIANNGQLLTYIESTNTWENYPSTDIISANANFKLDLGNVAHINIDGGAIGYVLETDGTGNLSWTPKGTLYTPIVALSNATPIIMTVANTTPYTNGLGVTISGANGANANSIVNGQTFYVKLAVNFATTGNVELYTDSGLSTAAVGTNLGASTPNVAIATASLGGTGGGGSGAAGGSTTTVQFNDGGVLAGNTGFTFDKNTTALTVNGNTNVGNLNATTTVTAPVLISNVSTGTAPLTISSTTRVSNLNVSYSNVSDFSVTTLQTTGTFYPLFANATSGNLAHGANANLSFNAATGALSSTLFTGTLTTAAQPNITSVGTLTSLSVSGNITGGNLIGPYANGTTNINVPTASGNMTFNVGGTANVLVLTTTGLVGNVFGPLANGNSNVRIASSNGNVTISAVGNANIVTVTGTGANISGTLSVSGNANVGNLGTSGRVISSILESNVATGTAPLTIASTTRVNNLNVAYANVSDFNVLTALTTGIQYPTFVSGTAGANYALGSNTAFSANIANGYFVATGITTTNISTGANVTAGNLTGNWTLSAGSRLQATYADLAEYYEADAVYPPGTVLEFGGEKEVTVASDESTRVAGVVSTNPAYLMNSTCGGDYPVAIALQGRVPVKVRGNISKGDMLVSGGHGYARPTHNPKIGTIIGKALADFDGVDGIIEIAVGRL